MNEGKNRWMVAYTVAPPESWLVRIDVQRVQRLSNKEELKIFKTGFLDYYTMDFLFGIYSGAGHCISGATNCKAGRLDSNKMVLDTLTAYRTLDSVPLTELELEKFYYLEELYKATKDCMLTRDEYIKFKKIYHALTRDDIDIAMENFREFHPQKILNKK